MPIFPPQRRRAAIAGVCLAGALIPALAIVACDGEGDVPDGTPSAMEATAVTPPPLAEELLELNLEAPQVERVLDAADPMSPFSLPSIYEEAWSWWFIPSATAPSTAGAGLPTPQPQVESFAMPNRYYDAGFIGFAVKRVAEPQGTGSRVGRPGMIDIGIAVYEDSEGAEEALTLGSRIYGLFPYSTLLSDDAQIGRDVLESVELERPGDGAVVDRILSATAISVRVKNYVGTVIIGGTSEEGEELPWALSALAKEVADSLVRRS